MSETQRRYSMMELVEKVGVSEGKIRDLLVTHMRVVTTRNHGRGAKNFTEEHLDILITAKPLLEAGIAIRFVAEILTKFPWLPQIIEDFLIQISEQLQTNPEQDIKQLQKLIIVYLKTSVE